MQSNCDRCHRRKGKCDRLQPCSSCRHAQTPCIYTDRARRRCFTAFEMERLEKRLRQAEARNQDLVNELNRGQVDAGPRDDQPALAKRGEGNEQQPCEADAVSEVSYLSINAAGERQPYLGSTSGLLFADLVRSSVDASAASGHPILRTTNAEQNNASATLSSGSTPDREPLDLPPKALAHNLITAYLEHDAIAYPILHVRELLGVSERIYQDETYYSSRASSYEVFIFNMVLAIATANVYKYDWHMLPSAESHHSRAMSELNCVLTRGGLPCLQAVLLLCQYRQGSSLKDNSASMWHLVGVAARICLELGLHRQSTYPLTRERLAPDQIERYRQQEVARRCFWCLIAMDRITSNILGRPHAIRHEDIDVEEPNDDCDAFFMPCSPIDAPLINRTAVFNCIIRYRLLCGDIMTTLHRRRGRHTTLAEALKIRETLAEDLVTWFAGVIDIGLPKDNPLTPQQMRSCFLSEVWFQVLFANAELMIWRPCSLLADITNDSLSLRKVYESSMKSINAYADLHKCGAINYSWITLHSTFLAGLSFIYAVSRHLRGRLGVSPEEAILLEKDPSTLEIVSMSRACSKVLVAVAERWNARRHCHEVIDRLSDAVLLDAMKVQSGEVSRPQNPSSFATPHSQNLSSTASSALHSFTTSTTAPSQLSMPNECPSVVHPGGGLTQQRLDLATTEINGPLAVDTEFLQCFDYLHSLEEHLRVEDPILYLTQDWMGYLSSSGGAGEGMFVS